MPESLRKFFPYHFLGPVDINNDLSSPDPYLKGAELLGVDPKRCLVVEDAPAGIASGLAAGCKTLAVITSHSGEAMKKEGTTYLVKNLARWEYSSVRNLNRSDTFVVYL